MKRIFDRLDTFKRSKYSPAAGRTLINESLVVNMFNQTSAKIHTDLDRL